MPVTSLPRCLSLKRRSGSRRRGRQIEAKLEQAQVKVQRVNHDNTEIRAHFDGAVQVKNANVGHMITPFSAAAGSLGAVVTMADMTTLEVEADVAECLRAA